MRKLFKLVVVELLVKFATISHELVTRRNDHSLALPAWSFQVILKQIPAGTKKMKEALRQYTDIKQYLHRPAHRH